MSRYDIKLRAISNVRSFDIDPLRYRRIIDIESFYIDIDSSRYRGNVDIEVQNFDIGIYRYRSLRFPSLDIDICSFDIHIRYRSYELRYRCFFAWIAVAPCSVLDTCCRVNYSLRIKRLACGLLRGRPLRDQSLQGQEWRWRACLPP
jgi:hypothetical protein